MGKRLMRLLLTIMMAITLLPGMGVTVKAETYDGEVSDLQVGDILAPGAIFNASGAGIKLQPYGWCTSNGDQSYTQGTGEVNIGGQPNISVTNEGAISHSDISMSYYPYANGKVDSWVVVSVSDEDNTITLTGYAETPSVVNVTGVTLDQETANLTVGGDPVTLEATVAPTNATDKTVTWSSSDTSIATVSDAGVVTAVAAGTATITATATNGTDDKNDDIIASCTVTVTSTKGTSDPIELDTKSTTAKPIKLAGTNDSVSYIDWDAEQKELVEKKDDQACKDYTVVTASDTPVVWNAGWYVVKDDNVTINGDISINGDVHLILCNGKTLTANSILGINNTGGNLSIYAQSVGAGKAFLTVSEKIEILYGNLTINGGDVTCEPKGSAAAIYSSGSITISGGKVTTNGIISINAIHINGGEVESTATGQYAGINSNSNMTISGGTVIAKATGAGGIGINGSSGITISGGTITATGKEHGIRSISSDITISGGTVNATGSGSESYGIHVNSDYKVIIGSSITNVIASGGQKAIFGNVANTIDGTGWTNSAGTEGKADIEISSEASALEYKKVVFPALVEYPLWVGGTQVTSENATSSDHPSWSYDATSHILSLNGANITAGDSTTKSGIYYKGTSASTEALTISLASTNTIKSNTDTNLLHGIYVEEAALTIKGDGVLNSVTVDIYSSGDLEISKGTVNANGVCSGQGAVRISGGQLTSITNANKGVGINSNNALTISGGTVIAKATGAEGIGINGSNGITISGGTITAAGTKYGLHSISRDITISGGTVNATGSGSESYGIHVNSDYKVIIGSSITKVIASGGQKAINGSVKNNIKGTGWTDKEGASGETAIAVNESGQELPADLKRVQFPAVHRHIFEYTASGATITAQCTAEGNCDYKEVGIVLTINAPENLVHDGNVKTVTITGYPETQPQGLADMPTAKYYKSTESGSTTPEGEELANAPKEVGNYVAQMTWGEQTASVAFTITEDQAVAAVIEKINALPDPANVTSEHENQINEARTAYDALGEKKALVSETLIQKLEADEDALAKTKFAEYKETKKAEAQNMAQEGDSQAASDLIAAAKDAVTNLDYDNNKSLDENKAAVDAIITKLTTDLANQRAADAVNKQIADLPAASDVTLNNKEAIEAARTAYNGLTDAQKALVDSAMITKLESDEAAITNLEAAKAVEDKIDALPDPADVKLDNEAAIVAARNAYNTLTPAQEALVDRTKKAKLENDEATLADLKAVKAVVDKITALPVPAEVKADNETAIDDAKKAYEALTETQKGKVSQELKNKLYADIAAVKNLISYSAVQGDGSSWTKGSTTGNVFRFNRNVNDSKTINEFIGIKVDNTDVDKSAYSYKAGSVVITLNPSYLETLSVGDHTLTAMFKEEKQVTVNFKVLAKPAPSEKESSSGSSTPKKDNVITCQMAGYPANYAWNEAAKACQPGYIDNNGVFHSTANAKKAGVPNTYDRGLTGSVVSLIASTVFAVFAAFMLKKFD